MAAPAPKYRPGFKDSRREFGVGRRERHWLLEESLVRERQVRRRQGLVLSEFEQQPLVVESRQRACAVKEPRSDPFLRGEDVGIRQGMFSRCGSRK